MFDFEEYAEIFAQNAALVVAVIVSAVLLLLLIAGIVASYFVLKKRNANKFTSRDMAYGAVCIGLSFALSFVGFKLPFEGTITLASTLPIMVYCYYFGFWKSVPVCIANMLLQFMQSYAGAAVWLETPFAYIMCAVLDYVLAYLALIFFGIFSHKNKPQAALKTQAAEKEQKPLNQHIRFFIAAACYIVVRYSLHVLSGAIVFGVFAPEGWNVVGYSLVYNLFFIADAAIALAAGIFLLSSKTFNRFMAVPGNTLQNADTRREND